MLEINKIINTVVCGNSLQILRQIPDNTISMCCTSPPYYNQRDYQTAQWIGGDNNCKHTRTNKRASCITGQKNVIGGIGDEIYKEICKKCGARRQDEQIGLENTPELYVDKLTEIFEEVRRVLKPSGTLWCVIADSYAGSNKGSNGIGGFSVKSKIQLGNKGSFVQPKKMYGYKNKDLLMIPAMLAFSLRNAGWYLRQDIIWAKKNPMPESVKDRCTKSHEYIFLLSKSPKYYYDYKAILEPAAYDGRKDTFFKGSNKYKNGFAPENINIQSFAKKGHERWSNKIMGRAETKMQGTGYAGDGSGLHKHSGYHDGDGKLRMNLDENGIPARNKRDVWAISTKPFSSGCKEVDHFATYPEELIVPCIKAGCEKGGIVLDPFAGTNTTGIVAKKLGRNFIGIELNPKYVTMSVNRIRKNLGMFAKNGF